MAISLPSKQGSQVRITDSFIIERVLEFDIVEYSEDDRSDNTNDSNASYDLFSIEIKMPWLIFTDVSNE